MTTALSPVLDGTTSWSILHHAAIDVCIARASEEDPDGVIEPAEFFELLAARGYRSDAVAESGLTPDQNLTVRLLAKRLQANAFTGYVRPALLAQALAEAGLGLRHRGA